MTLQRKAVALAILTLFGAQGCSVPDSAHAESKPQPVLAVSYERSPIVPVTIADEQYQFLLDTGASITVLDRRIASRFKALSLSQLPRAYQADFANMVSVSGQIESEHFGFVQPVPFSVGSVTIDDSDLWGTMDFSLISQSLGTRIDGVLGIEVIRRFNWLFDQEQHQISAWSSAPSAAGFERCIGYDDSYNRSPALYLTQGEGSLRMLLDTGADQSYVDRSFIGHMAEQQALLKDGSTPMKGVDASGMQDLGDHVIIGLHFDGRPLGQLRVSENDNDKYALGMDFVSRFKRFAIIPGRMMFCYDAETLAQQVQPNLRQIAVRFDGQHLQLYYNDERDLAPFGLKNGDVIEQINGVPYHPIQIDRVRDLLNQSKAGSLKVRVVREGKALDIAI